MDVKVAKRHKLVAKGILHYGMEKWQIELYTYIKLK